MGKAKHQCACGSCRSCISRRAWARGDYDGRRKTLQWNGWTHEEDELLRRMAGTASPDEIGEAIGREFGHVRSAHGVKRRAEKLGLSLYQAAWSPYSLACVLGVDPGRVRTWLTYGWLRARTVGDYNYRRITDADARACLRARPWLVDYRGVRRGTPLRAYTELLHRTDPYFQVSEASALTGVPERTLRLWVYKGRIVAERRGAPYKGVIYISARQLRTLRELYASEGEVGA